MKLLHKLSYDITKDKARDIKGKAGIKAIVYRNDLDGSLNGVQ